MPNSQKILTEYLSSIATLSSRSQYVRHAVIRQYSEYLEKNNKTLLTATLPDLTKFASKKLENKDPKKRVKRITFKIYLLYILYFYEYAFDEDHYPLKEFKRIRKYVRRFKFDKGDEKTRLTNEQVQQLLEATNKHITIKIATWMFLSFGFRVTELLNLQLDHIDLDKDLITVHLGKGRKTRRIPILDYQRLILKQLLTIRKRYVSLKNPTNYFLINKNTSKQVGPNWLQDRYVELSKELGFRVHAHRLRRTFASILFFDFDIDIYLIAWLLGHTSIQTTMIYLGIKEQRKIDEYIDSMQGKRIVRY